MVDLRDLGEDVVGLGGGVADVGHGGHVHEALLVHLGQVQRPHELAHAVAVHAAPARQLLQALVRPVHPVLAHHRLDGLRQHLPVAVQVRCHGAGVGLQLAQAAQRGEVRDERVPEARAQVAQHGGVREVPLPARHRQLGAQVLEHGVGHADVALGVLEVDGVHLVRHGAGPDLPRDGALLEVPDADVPPDVPVHVQHDGVVPRHAREQLRHVVVRLDLRHVRVELQPQAHHELLRHQLPVHLGVRRHRRVVVAHGARHLAVQRNLEHLRALPGQAVRHVGELLAQGGGGRGLAVRAADHGGGRLHLGHLGDDVHDLAHGGGHGVDAAAQHQGVRQVVDVLGRAREVHKLQHLGELGVLADAVLDDVLHRLDVVVGGALHLLHLRRVRRAEVRQEVLEELVGVGAQRGHLGDLGDGGQLLQPPHLDDDAGAHQGVLREARAQHLDLGAVAPVDGGDGGEVVQRQVHLRLEVVVRPKRHRGSRSGRLRNGAHGGGDGAARTRSRAHG
mmetsp:Transcript_40673/g.100512  ORF Transcript_40673/g.100512 Transcript_40673/m.100512 type:complete len:506 (+) Transcript_40673:240-1757(+)